MSPKRIGFLGFEGAAALNLVGPADAFSTAALDDGYGNRISCYEICTIGLSSEPFQAESGMIFNTQETLGTAPELDTIVIPGGKGLRRSEINERISDWILTRANRTRRIAWIMRNLHEDLSVNALARRVCMSPSHFNRAFKSVFGSTPADFVENLRVNEARRRLSTPRKTLYTVAASVGFSSASEFRRAF